MVLFPNLTSADSDDQHRVRARLIALRRASGSPAESIDPDATDPAIPLPDFVASKIVASGVAAANAAIPNAAGPDIIAPHTTIPDEEDRPPVAARDGRLVRRWVPASLRTARWEPGKPGALMLSLVAALAAVIAAVGVWWERPVPVPAPSLPLVTPAQAADPAAPPSAAPELVVSVVGRVARPGLIRVADGARVADALEAAGGALPETDLTGLNLARRLTDGEQLLVGVAPPPGQPADGAALSAPAGSALIDLNSATLEQLDSLPGVGPVTAQRILDWRAANGRFRSVDQLREVSGIGESRFARLKDLVRV